MALTAPAGFHAQPPDETALALQNWLEALGQALADPTRGPSVVKAAGYSDPLSSEKANAVAASYPPISPQRAKDEFHRWAVTYHPGVFGVAIWNEPDANWVGGVIPLLPASDDQVRTWFREQYHPGYIASVGYPLPDDKGDTLAAYFRRPRSEIQNLWKAWVNHEHGDDDKSRSIVERAIQDVEANPVGAVAGAVVIVSAAPAIPLILGAGSVVAAVGYGGAATLDATGVTDGAVSTLNKGAEYAATHPAEIGEAAAAGEVAVAGVAIGGAAGAAITSVGLGILGGQAQKAINDLTRNASQDQTPPPAFKNDPRWPFTP